MRLAEDPIRTALQAATVTLQESAAAFRAGSAALEATDLSAPDWRPAFDAAVTRMGTDWNPPHHAINDLRAALAALGTDPRATAAVQAVDGALATMQRAYNYIGHVFYDLPADADARLGGIALARCGQAGRAIATSIDDAAAAVRQLSSQQS